MLLVFIRCDFLMAEGQTQDYLDDADLEVAFHSALSLLGVGGYSVRANFRPFSSVRSQVSVSRVQMLVTAEVSDAYRLASPEVVFGLALSFCSKLFRRPADKSYLAAYEEFSKRGSLYKLSDSIRLLRGRKRKDNHEGAAHDLEKIGAEVFSKYSRTLRLGKMPVCRWNDRGGRRTLAFYDRAFDEVLISRVFDSPKVPQIVLEYLCFHEFLHATHAPLYERGKSRRVIVHSTAFRRDEESFEGYSQANEWIRRNIGKLD